MPWCYEIRGPDGRLVETRTAFATEEKALKAGQRAMRMIRSICDSSLVILTLVTKEDQSTEGNPSELPAEPVEVNDVATNHGSHLKFPWQQAVLDAFLEPHPQNLPRRINVAERAISARLLEADPFELDERIALGEALLALRRLVREQSRTTEETTDKKGIA